MRKKANEDTEKEKEKEKLKLKDNQNEKERSQLSINNSKGLENINTLTKQATLPILSSKYYI